MKPVFWFRSAAFLSLVFATGHTWGFLSFHPTTAQGQAVWSAMNSVTFSEGNRTFSYGNFYLGFGLFIGMFELFLASLCWWLGQASRLQRIDCRPLSLTVLLVEVGSLGLSLRYFGIGPAVLSVLVALCLLIAVIRESLSTTQPA